MTTVILDGAFNCVKSCLPHLRASGEGVIWWISAGSQPVPGAARRPHVVTAKAGLVGFHTRARARACARRHPG